MLISQRSVTKSNGHTERVLEADCRDHDLQNRRGLPLGMIRADDQSPGVLEAVGEYFEVCWNEVLRTAQARSFLFRSIPYHRRHQESRQAVEIYFSAIGEPKRDTLLYQNVQHFEFWSIFRGGKTLWRETETMTWFTHPTTTNGNDLAAAEHSLFLNTVVVLRRVHCESTIYSLRCLLFVRSLFMALKYQSGSGEHMTAFSFGRHTLVHVEGRTHPWRARSGTHTMSEEMDGVLDHLAR